MPKINLRIAIFLFVFLQIFAVHHQYLHQSEISIDGSYLLHKTTKPASEKTNDHECLLCNFIHDFQFLALSLFSLQIVFFGRGSSKKFYQSNFINWRLFLKKFSQGPPPHIS